MDWNTVLFAIRWVIIALFYFVLLVLLVGVYREAASRLDQKPGKDSIVYGRLKVIQPGGNPKLAPGAVLNLKPVTNLGAEQDNDIVLEDQFVSGHHLRLSWVGVALWLEDLNSKNGTLVNHQPVAPGRLHALRRGATITIGDMTAELID